MPGWIFHALICRVVMSQRKQKPITNFFNTSKHKAPTHKTKTSGNKNKDHDEVKTEVDIKEEDDILLKAFDLNWVFGPCSGLSRLDRWERASKFSLHPPQEVKDLILKNSKNTLYTTCIWDQNALLKPWSS